MDINITNPVTKEKIGEVINGAASATPNDTDLVMSVESSVAKKNTWTQIKAFLKTYFDTVYQVAGSYLTSANITQTITNGVTDKAPSEDAVKSYADAKVGSAMTQAINEAKGSDIASAATTDIGAATGNFVHVTGTTTITALGTVQAGTRRIVRFAGALTLTHNATSLILPTGANITTAANDVATFVSEGSGNWRCVGYLKADGSALSGGTIGVSTALFKTNANYAHTGTLNETVLFSTGDLNGNFDVNDIFRILLNYNCTSNGNSKTIKIYLGAASQTQGNTFNASGTTQLATMLLTTNAAMKRGIVRNIQFMNSLSSQQVVATTTNGLDNDETGLSSNATLSSMTWDYSTATHLIVTGTLASSGDTINFLHFRGQIIR